MKTLFQLTIILFLTISCTAQNNLKEYYYPITNTIETKVYKYVDKNDSNKIEYWKVTTIPETNEIKTISYDSKFNIYNIFNEIITENGAVLTLYADYEKNALGEMIPNKAEIVEKDVYKWNGDREYTYSVKYKNDYGRIEIKKKRTELGYEKIKVNGKIYNTAKFKGEYLNKALDLNDSYKFHQYSYYAKGIGMVKYERYIQNKIIELELTKILTETEFEDLIIKASR